MKKMKFIVLVCLISLSQSASVRRNDCCADLGCFSTTGDFHSLANRPISVAPNCDIVSTFKLLLNTRLNPIDPQRVDSYDFPTIVASNFDAARETKILIHGFTDRFDWPWWTDMIRDLLEEGDFNIIRLDWASGNAPPFYQATANTRLAGAYVARFINALKTQLSYSPSKIHIIGHSLGAHIAGYAGERVDKVARISGIDPAGPYFSNMPASVRLDDTDASVVDTLVTDGEPIISLGFGSQQAMGHLNFYVNGGLKQPGCSSLFSPGSIISGPTSFNSSSFDFWSSSVQTFYQTVGCNHWRALSIYTESISRNKCSMKSYMCISYAEFLKGNCFGNCEYGRCANVGYHANTSLIEQHVQKKFFTVTTDRPAFCTYSYKLNLKLQGKTSSNNARKEEGKLYIILFGMRASSIKIALTADDIDLNPGAELQFLLQVPKELGPIESAVINWKAPFSALPSNWLRRKYIYIDGNLEVQDENQVTSFLRPARQELEDEKEIAAESV